MDGNAGLILLERTVCGRPLRAEIRRLDEGIHVLLTGGDKSHIGAVSWAEPGEEVRTQVFPGHRDDVLSEPWAESIALAAGQRTLVVCGIHYDNASREDIAEIVRTAGKLLQELLPAILDAEQNRP